MADTATHSPVIIGGGYGKPKKPRKRVNPAAMATEANNRLNAKKPKPAPIPRPERLAQITGSSRTYAPGMQTNRTKNERANKKFRTFFKNGQAFHEYQIKGKRVVVKGNNNPSRKLKPYGKG